MIKQLIILSKSDWDILINISFEVSDFVLFEYFWIGDFGVDFVNELSVDDGMVSDSTSFVAEDEWHELQLESILIILKISIVRLVQDEGGWLSILLNN